MFLSKEESIRTQREKIREELKKEWQTIDYEKRWLELKNFRTEMAKYVEGYNDCDENNLMAKLSILSNGHILDHHALGYFAPMKFKRWGFKNRNGELVKRSPDEQIKVLSRYFEEHNIRFIYVPIPCKVAVDPKIAVKWDVIPEDGLVIPQWREILWKLAEGGVELIDCYSMLRTASGKPFTKNHHISPIGARIIAEAVSDYICNTTVYSQNEKRFICRDEIIGSPVLLNSGNNNSREVGAEYFESTRVFFKDSAGLERPYLGKNTDSKIVIVGDCNLQSYRGQGVDVTAQIAGKLKYPVEYLGRYLPFAKNDSIDKLPEGSLYDKEIVIYIGFVSASFVRANNDEDVWSMDLPGEEIFRK